MPSTLKSISINVAVISFLGLVVFGAWKLERKLAASEPGAKAAGGEFVVDLPKEQKIDLVIQCNEEFFQEAYKRFREEHLGIYTEPLVIPGGIITLVAVHNMDLRPKDFDSIERTVVEALKRSSPRRVVLTAHSQCLIYDLVAAWQNEGEKVRTRQLSDLEIARNVIKRMFPNAQVDVYYADREGDKLRFRPILQVSKEVK